MLDQVKKLMEMKKQADILKKELEATIIEVTETRGIKLVINGAQIFQSIEIEEGLLGNELTRMNEAFNCWITTGRPFVTAKIAQTIDGRIACPDGSSKWITSAYARDWAHRLRFGFDAILVGINTVLKDDPQLRTLPLKRIKKIILDTNGQMPSRAKLLAGAKPEDVFVFTARPERFKIKAQIIKAPVLNGRIDLKWVLQFLGDRSLSSLLIEGGSAVVGDALARNLVDKMMIYTAPKIMGDGIASVRGLKSKNVAGMIKLRDMSVDKIGEDILIQGYLCSQASLKK